MSSALSYFKVIPNGFFTWSIFFTAATLFYLGLIFKRKASFSVRELLNRWIPFNPVKSKSFHMDVITYVVTKVALVIWTVPGFAAYAAVSATISHSLQGEYGLKPSQTANPVVDTACALLVFISIEFAYYIVHYTNHKVPFLWELHKVHHSADVLNPLTNTRAHPASQAYKFIVTGIISGIPTGVFMFLYGFSLPEFIVLNAVTNKFASVLTLDTLRHSHVPIRFGPIEGVIMSPHMHHIHHSNAAEHLDKNFGLNLSLFDSLFGTLYRPRKDEIPVIGLYQCDDASLQEYNTLWGAYVTPLTRGLQTLVKPVQIRFENRG
jgi:sterol desaturase/sphingolipid hydroxylase (fatty acid hydroxylase superfamily)